MAHGPKKGNGVATVSQRMRFPVIPTEPGHSPPSSSLEGTATTEDDQDKVHSKHSQGSL